MRALRLTGLALVLAIGSFAAPITITYNSTGTGSVGGTPFTAATFTLTELLDTTNRVSFSGGFFIDDNSTSIAITGIGTFAFTTPTRSFVNNSVSGEGFSRAGVAGADLMQAATNVAFATWDMTTPLGPFTGTGALLQWSTTPVQTTGGTLIFNNGNPTVTFQAFAGVPEPASVALVGLGLAGLFFATRRKPSQQQEPLAKLRCGQGHCDGAKQKE